MILYVNGDSNSAGHEAGGVDFSYGKYLADYLNADLRCDATPACSNDYIINTTLKYLENNSPDFVIIGWSTWERETWYLNDNIYHITSSGASSVHDLYQTRYKEWVIYNSNGFAEHYKEKDNHVKIWLLHKYLQAKQIKHLFFNCYSYFFYTSSYTEPRYDWGNNYISPYTEPETYYFWLKNKGFTPTEHLHFKTEAHRAWADHLLPMVKNLLTE